MSTGGIEDFLPEEMKIGLVDYICYKHTRSSLQELRLILGQHQLLGILNKLSGSYIMLPSSKQILRLKYDFLAALTVKRIRQARKDKDMAAWNQEESNLQKIAKKTKRTYRYTYLRGIHVLKESERILLWRKKLETWSKKFLTP